MSHGDAWRDDPACIRVNSPLQKKKKLFVTVPDDRRRLVHECARSAQLVRGGFIFSSPTSSIYSTPRSCKLLDLGGRCSLRFPPAPRSLFNLRKSPNHAQGSRTLLHVLLVFVCILLFLILALEQQSPCTLPPPPRRPHPPPPTPLPVVSFERARKESKKTKQKKKCRITFGHVSPRTLCAQVAIEKLPLRKRAAAVTINPTSSVPSLPKLARMVRRAFCLLIFLSCLLFPPSFPHSRRLWTALSLLLLLCLSLSPSLSFARELAVPVLVVRTRDFVNYTLSCC